MSNHYLVTGGAGFIGSHLTDALLAAGHRVTVIDDLSTGKLSNLPENNDSLEVVIGDCGYSSLIERTIAKVDGVFHLAAVASVQKSKEEWCETHRVNQSGTVALLDAIAKDGRKLPFVYASSAAVFGDPDASLMPLSEDTPLAPLTPYGADKAGCELHANAARAMHAIPTMGFRFFNVYGPRQDPSSPYSGVISIFADKLANNAPITIFGDGQQTRDFIHVSSIVSYLTNGMSLLESQACEAPRLLHACTGKATSITELAETMASILGCEATIHHAPARDGDIQHSLGNNTQLTGTFPDITYLSLKEGLSQLLNA